MATIRDLKGILIFSSGLYDRKNNKTGDFPEKHGETSLVIYGVVNDSVVRTERRREWGSSRHSAFPNLLLTESVGVCTPLRSWPGSALGGGAWPFL